MTNWTACQSLRDMIITSVGRKRSMLISSMMSLDRENAKTGQCTNADIWREATKKAPQAVEAGARKLKIKK